MSENPQLEENTPTPPADIDLIERFIAAHNAIDRQLQRLLGEDEKNSFRSLVDTYAQRHKWWRDGERLRVFANLRNIIVHDKTVPYTYICVPTVITVTEIERIRDRLLDPPRVIPAFAREVTTIQPNDTLDTVLVLIDEYQYSRLPVYAGSRFIGLLTENGITHWLARRVATKGTPLDIKVPVRDVLPKEDRRARYKFVSRDTAVEQVAYQFHENTFLEAVLITHHGREHEPLLGIVTRGDVLQFWS